MYLSSLSIENFRQFGDTPPAFTIKFHEGVTALVGQNDAGKTAVIDAIRHVLQTRDADFMRLQPEDFHITPNQTQKSEITLLCQFSNLSTAEQGAFAEYLTYDDAEISLYVYWTARRLSESAAARRWVDISVRTGKDGSGPNLDSNVRQLLAAAYLRPLRDAEREMSPGRGSRLSQILSNFPDITRGNPLDATNLPTTFADAAALNLAGMSDYLRHLVDGHPGVSSAQTAINDDYLKLLSLSGEQLHGRINFVEGATEAAKLRQILERLELGLLENTTGATRGTYGLGSNNLLFMACELLLLGKELEGLPLLLIEEPEAHLHPQRQLRLMQFLESAAKPPPESDQRPVQVILSTHSPNLSSKIPLKNMVLMHRQRAYSLTDGQTELSTGDYRFLDRFLDVTKANLFFSRGLLIVEGDGESILLPTIASLVGRDLTEHGVSVVNVGGTGLRRYARILQRRNPDEGQLQIPTACLADMDVMPDCAPQILGLVADDDDAKWTSSTRRWKAVRDFGANPEEQAAALFARRDKLGEGDGQNVATFIADHWTLEYDLAACGLAKEVYLAATLAMNDDPLNEDRKTRSVVLSEAHASYLALEALSLTAAELCSRVYKMFGKGKASKAITAQYLAELLEDAVEEGTMTADQLRASLPTYIVSAIEFATTPMRDQIAAVGAQP
ncbi:ATP-dependent nuclease [Pseudomonas syringae]|uniref:ATP-dependent nuclease n=1 Tax=Pseudomonas syringae TaxID=317 RepID=UPI000EFE4AE9|nr:AAA family ATPase [Pseudomonas syringae]